MVIQFLVLAGARRLGVGALALACLHAVSALPLVAAAGSISPSAAPPEGYLSRSWTTDHGLPHNVVHRVAQDAAGFLWLATAGGLVRFDGRAFATHVPPPELSQGESEIRDLVVTPSGDILVIVAVGGVLRFRDGVFTVHPLARELGGRSVTELFAEPDGSLWVGAEDGALFHWSEGRCETYGRADGIGRRGLGFTFARDGAGVTWIAAADFVGCFRDGRLVREPEPRGGMIQLAPARDGGLWALVDGSLQKYSAGAWRPVALPELPWVAAGSSVRHLLEDNSGVLWFSTASAGLFRLREGRLFREAAPHPLLAWMTLDREANLWVATSGDGVRRLHPRAFNLHHDTSEASAVIGTSVCAAPSGDVWFANLARGLVRSRAGHLEAFPCQHDGRGVYVTCVAPAPDGDLWLGASAGLFRFSPARLDAIRRAAPLLPNIHVLRPTRAGDLWIATQTPSVLGRLRGDTWRAFGAAEGFTGANVTAIEEDADGVLWVGTRSGGLFRFAGETFTPVALDPGRAPVRIHCLQADPDGALWIGTLGGLVLRRGEHLRRFTRADGLVEDNVGRILADDAGRLWLGGARGLYSVARADLLALADAPASARPAAVPVRSYGLDDGLPGVSVSTRFSPGAWKDARGTLWFASTRGMIALDPGAVRLNPLPPPIIIDRLLIDEQPAALRPGVASLLLSPGPHRLEFGFAAACFTAPEKVVLRHRLEGIDPDWVDASASRAARYNNLPAGDYRLRVIGCNNDGIWNETGSTLAFTIPLFWWQTPGFRAAAALTLAALVAGVVRAWTRRRLLRRLEKLEREQAVAQERARIGRNLHDELGGGITGLGLVVERLASQHPAAPLRRELGDRIRRLGLDLERVVWTVSPRDDSLDRLVEFIARFTRGYFLDTPVRCLVTQTTAIPPRAVSPEMRHHILAVVKEAAHNVLKHARASRIEIESGVRDGRFHLRIRDDGAGFDPAVVARADGNGLPNLRARVAELGGEFRIESRPGAGVEITLVIPL